MSVISAAVTRGITYTEDSQGRILQTKERLHQLGTPTVTVELTGLVASEDLQSGSVVAAKLSDVIQDLLSKVELTVGAEASDAIEVTIQKKDAADNNLAEYGEFECWLSDSNTGGGETSSAPNTSFSVTTGTELEEVTSKIRLKVITDSNGTAKVTVDNTGGGTDTWYLNVSYNGKVYISDAITITI